ncbi:hypothetical protein PMAYCL1PPCAC_19512, partial [Pristionchus mayeri]
GWINVSNYVPSTSKVSWCNYEFTVEVKEDMMGERPGNITLAAVEADPPIQMLCVNVVTALNEKKEQEILLLSMLSNSASYMENPSTDLKAFRRMS